METEPESSVRAPGTSTALTLAAMVGVALAAAAWLGDGSDVDGILPAGGAAVVLLAGALAAVGLGYLPSPRVGRSGAAVLVAMLLLVVWTGATMGWSIVPDRSWDAFNRSVAFGAFLGLGVVLAGAAGRIATRLTASMLGIVTGAVLVWALLTKIVPSLDPEGDRVARLREPVGYWNALALLADVGLALGLWLGASRGHRTTVRVAGGLLVYVATLSLMLTLSRVGLAAAAAVVVLWLALSEERVEGGLLLAAAGGPAALVGAWAYTRPALVEDVAERSDRVADGAVLGVLAAVGALAVAALVVVGARRGLGEGARRSIGRGLLAVTALTVIVGRGGARVRGRAVGRVGCDVRRDRERSEPAALGRPQQPVVLVGGRARGLPRAFAGRRRGRLVSGRAEALPGGRAKRRPAAQRSAPAACGRRSRGAGALPPARARSGCDLRRCAASPRRAGARGGGRARRGAGRVRAPRPRRLRLGLPRGDGARDGRAGIARGGRTRGGGAPAPAAPRRSRGSSSP